MTARSTTTMFSRLQKPAASSGAPARECFRVLFAFAFTVLSAAPCIALRHDELRRPAPLIQSALPSLPSVRIPSEAQLEHRKTAVAEGIAIDWSSELGVPTRVRGPDLSKRGSFSPDKKLLSAKRDERERRALAVLDNLSGLFSIADAQAEFKPELAKKDSLGFQHVRLAQNHRGLKVIGGEITVHFNANDLPYEVSGRYLPDIDIEPRPALDADQALILASEYYQPDAATRLAKGPELVIFAFNSKPRLAYEIVLLCEDDAGLPESRRCWIDANSGAVLLSFNDVKKILEPTDDGFDHTMNGKVLSGEGGATVGVTGWKERNGYYYLWNKKTYWSIFNYARAGYPDSFNYAYRLTANWGGSDEAEMSAAVNFHRVQDYFYSRHERRSFDDANAYARANVHVGSGYVNAFWDGSAFFFGDGDSSSSDCLAVLDVCAHEFTHAITEHTASLFYYGEPGALNESFSDIFAVCVEFHAQPDGSAAYPNALPGHADWLIGEDCWLEGTALRDLRNPSSTVTLAPGNQLPSRYKGTHWYEGKDDNGGVHINNMPHSHFFYLLCEGGSGNNDGILYDVTGIGLENAEQIAYRALTVYFSQYTDYSEALGCWISAATDLNTNWISSVTQAWAAIGVTDDYVESDDLATALNAPTLRWFTDRSAQWFSQTEISHDDMSAAQSGAIGHGEQTRMHTTVVGPGTLYFWWTVSSEKNYDFLRFYIDGAELASISGQVDWQNISFVLSEGTHMLKWKYTKDSSRNTGLDAGWVDQVTWIPAAQPQHKSIPFDFDGDAKSDAAVYHPQSGFWYLLLSTSGELSSCPLGGPDYSPVPADFDGDGKTDLAVYHEPSGYWHVLQSSDFLFSSAKFGGQDYSPVPADFDGDGKADLAVFNRDAGDWYILLSSAQSIYFSQLGGLGCLPVPVDFDGDGRADIAVYHESSGYWFAILSKSDSLSAAKFGDQDYSPVPADFDGDGKADLAVYHESSGYWFVLLSESGTLAFAQFGGPGFAPVAVDFDGDGKADLAVYHEGTGYWYILHSGSGGISYFKLGEVGYKPVMK